MMLGLLPKMLVILVLFLALFDPPPVSGLKCYNCGLNDIIDSVTSDLAGSENGTGTNLRQGGSSTTHRPGPMDSCPEDIKTIEGYDCKHMYALGSQKFVCAKQVVKDKVMRTCTLSIGQAMECTKSGETEACYCDDKDLCNGGSPLRNGFGMMSLALGAVYYVFC